MIRMVKVRSKFNFLGNVLKRGNITNIAYYSLPRPKCWMQMICEILLYVIKLILEQILDQKKSAMEMKFEERDGDPNENYILTRFDGFIQCLMLCLICILNKNHRSGHFLREIIICSTLFEKHNVLFNRLSLLNASNFKLLPKFLPHFSTTILSFNTFSCSFV